MSRYAASRLVSARRNTPALAGLAMRASACRAASASRPSRKNANRSRSACSARASLTQPSASAATARTAGSVSFNAAMSASPMATGTEAPAGGTNIAPAARATDLARADVSAAQGVDDVDRKRLQGLRRGRRHGGRADHRERPSRRGSHRFILVAQRGSQARQQFRRPGARQYGKRTCLEDTPGDAASDSFERGGGVCPRRRREREADERIDGFQLHGFGAVGQERHERRCGIRVTGQGDGARGLHARGLARAPKIVEQLLECGLRVGRRRDQQQESRQPRPAPGQSSCRPA